MKTPLLLKYFWKFLVFLILTVACEDGEPVASDSSETYFPLQTGFYQVYAVSEKVYSAGKSEPVVSQYEMITQVVDSFPSGEHEYTFVVHRSTRVSEGSAWQPLDTWSVRRDRHRVVVAEGNTSFVKMTFPASELNRWNGNTFNTLGEDEYEMHRVGQPMQLNGMTFDRTLTVEQERNEDLVVFRDVRTEVYARDAGLVYNEVIQLNYCTDDHCLGQQKVDHGVELKMEIKAYGQH
jgi:hypothetical protein